MHSSLTVITPAACLDLTVLATVKTELGIPPGDTSQDDRLGVLIKQASGIVADYCGQVFGAEEVEEIFWSDRPSWWGGEWVRAFMLARARVTSVESVVIDGMLLDPSSYRLGSDGHLHRLDIVGSSHWMLSSEAIIQYTAGYVLLDDLPYGIERATLSLIKGYQSATGRDPWLRSEDIPGLRSVTYQIGTLGGRESAMLPPDVIALLAPYKRMVFA